MAEGGLIRVPIPDLSEERRKDMVKVAGRYAEACKVAMRNIRRDGIETSRKAEKDGLISEDERHQQEADVQKVTDIYVKKVDDALAQKKKKLLKSSLLSWTCRSLHMSNTPNHVAIIMDGNRRWAKKRPWSSFGA